VDGLKTKLDIVVPRARRRFSPERASRRSAHSGPLSQFGPFIAIGRPGEQFATLGAAREYLSDQKWQGRVLELIPKCRVIILLVGTTGGLGWEMDQLVRFNMLHKLILLLPPVNRPQMEFRWRKFLTSVATLESLHLPSEVRDDATLGVFGWQLTFYFVRHSGMNRSKKLFVPKLEPYVESLTKQLTRGRSESDASR